MAEMTRSSDFRRNGLKFLTKMLWINNEGQIISEGEEGMKCCRMTQERLRFWDHNFVFVLNRILEIRLLISKPGLALRKALS